MSDILKIHASLAVVEGKGVLLRGKSGSGKSDLLLRLLENKKALLVADDVVELQKSGKKVTGHAPLNLRGLLEVRGVGIAKYDFVPETEINLLVNLQDSAENIRRLPQIAQELILGVEIPAIDLYAKEVSAPEKIIVKLRDSFLRTE